MPWYRLTDTQKKAIQLALRDAYPERDDSRGSARDHWPWRVAKGASAALENGVAEFTEKEYDAMSTAFVDSATMADADPDLRNRHETEARVRAEAKLSQLHHHKIEKKGT
jgi:hypothetical protein